MNGSFEFWALATLFGVGVVAGFLNVVAGGGSLLTMPAMILLGLPPAAANGTNRVALVAQNVASVATFRKQGFSDLRLSLTLGLCTLPGAVAGALAAVRIDPTWFKRLLVAVMVLVAVSMIVRPRRRPPGHGEEPETTPEVTRWRRLAAHLGMVAVGFYGGFLQAGVGFILMAILHRALRLDLVRVNMHKVFVVGMYMLPSLVVFALLDQVRWIAGLALAGGNAIGGWIGTRAQISRGEGIVRVVLLLAIAAMCVRLLWD